MINHINGFLIVRRSLADAAGYQDICRIGNKEYRGVERAHLEDQRTLFKINYRIHTGAIKESLIPPTSSGQHRQVKF